MMGIKVVFPHKPDSTGGPGTFQNLISDCLRNEGADILPHSSEEIADFVFVIGGTKKIGWLRKQKRKGAKVLHRLDGMKWRHWVEKSTIKHKVLFSFQNRMTALIRSRFADLIVYQSSFVENWWNERFGTPQAHSEIIPNGTDLDHFKPSRNEGKAEVPTLVCFEGNVELDEPTIFTLREIENSLVSAGFLKEVLIWGKAKDSERQKLEGLRGIRLMGGCERQEVAEKMRQGDIFLSLDVNAACPNSVIEAMASGLPVVGFETGALKELVDPSAGELSPYGANPWKLENPDVQGLVSALKRILIDLDERKRKAREVAEQKFGKDLLVGRYMEAVKKLLKPMEKKS